MTAPPESRALVRSSAIRWWAVILVLYFLSRLALFWRAPVFWDEGFYAVQAQTGLDFPASRFTELLDGKGPLFHWISISFVGAGASPLASVRLVSLLAGLATLTATALVAKRLTPGAEYVAGGLYVAMPFFLVHDARGLVDPLLAALMSTALLLQLQQAERARLDRSCALGLVMGAGLLTRDLGLLALVLLPLSLVRFDFAAESVRTRLTRWTGCSLVSFVLAWLCRAVIHLSPYRPQFAPARSMSEVLHDPFANVPAIWPDVSSMLLGYVGLPLLVVLLGVVVFAPNRRLVLLIAVWAALPFAAMILFTQWGYPRYVLPAIGPLTALMSVGLVGIWRDVPSRLSALQSLRDRPRLVRWIAGGAVVAVLLVPAVLDVRILHHPDTAKYPGEDFYQYAAGWPSGTGLDVIGHELDKRAAPGQTVVASVDFTPWNLAVRFDHPLRVPLGGPQPYKDGAVAHSRGRTIFFLPYGAPHTADAQFVLTQSGFAVPPGFEAAKYKLVATYKRPSGAVVQGQPVPRTSLMLFERSPSGEAGR